MKIKYKPKQSTNNSTKRIIRDSNPKAIVGTLVGFILVFMTGIIIGGISSVNNVFAASYEYSIKYNDNVVDNMPIDVNDGKAVGGNLSLASDAPKRDGYKFLGWCNTVPSTNITNNTDSCSGTTYQPKAGITIASAANFHFYAMWKEANTFNKAFAAAGKTQLDGYYKMQDASGSICTAVDEGETGTLIDTRDKQTYTVAKLADGKCWMTENLNIAGGTALSSNDTDFDSAYILPTTNGWVVSNNKLVLPPSSTSGFDTGNYAYVYNSNNKTNRCGWSPGCHSYYSWDAATLGSGRSIYTDNTDALYSICPKNWRLPTSRSTVAGNSDFFQLAVAYGMSSSSTSENTSNFFRQAGDGSVPNFPLPKYYKDGSFYNGPSVGGFWSATARYGSWAYSLYFHTGAVYSASSDDRKVGYAVRCVFAE